MEQPTSGLVEIAREFLLAYRRTREVAALHRSGDLSFEIVRNWVGDDETSALFRLKECCHNRFRAGGDGAADEMERELLFDLTVGALFHEAMRFRENYYQREIYGPQVRGLRGTRPEEKELIREFERILSGASLRLDEALQEVEALIDQTRRQFQGLLEDNRRDGLVTRYLIQNAGYVALVYESGLDALLAEVHGDTARGFALAARSHLESGHFDDALVLLEQAIEREPPRSSPSRREEWTRLREYARGMADYLAGRYAESLAALARWAELEPPPEDEAFVALALDAVSHAGHLADEADRAEVTATADALTERLRGWGGEAA